MKEDSLDVAIRTLSESLNGLTKDFLAELREADALVNGQDLPHVVFKYLANGNPHTTDEARAFKKGLIAGVYLTVINHSVALDAQARIEEEKEEARKERAKALTSPVDLRFTDSSPAVFFLSPSHGSITLSVEGEPPFDVSKMATHTIRYYRHELPSPATEPLSLIGRDPYDTIQEVIVELGEVRPQCVERLWKDGEPVTISVWRDIKVGEKPYLIIGEEEAEKEGRPQFVLQDRWREGKITGYNGHNQLRVAFKMG
ncbi:MAG: hypothetical protein EOM02_08460 [Synergistales bacterium]|nr:hypothetical protein [Synergistales bacterium]